MTTPDTPTADILLKPKIQKVMARRHPWIFSGAVRTVDGAPADGDVVRIRHHDGQAVGLGHYNGQSDIRVRVLSWSMDETLDDAWWQARIAQAIQRRVPRTEAGRLINAENDFLPGLIVDQYGSWLVMQCLSLGIDRRKHQLAEWLAEQTGAQGVYERSDVDIRAKEGLAETTGVLWGDPPPEKIIITEHDAQLAVDVYHGHKTGFYLDQAANRWQLRRWLDAHPQTGQMTVLNAFSFTGGFNVAALAGGAARAIAVDSSAEALALARENVALNGFPVQDADFVQADVFEKLRAYRDAGQTFDVIILDPPKFARHAGQVQQAARGYKDINWLAFQLLKPGGLLWTFSCSNAVDADLFQKIVFGALVDAGREGQIIGRLGAAPDHPVALTFPEGEYLKGLICRVE